jgi:hypothetical protein
LPAISGSKIVPTVRLSAATVPGSRARIPVARVTTFATWRVVTQSQAPVSSAVPMAMCRPWRATAARSPRYQKLRVKASS